MGWAKNKYYTCITAESDSILDDKPVQLHVMHSWGGGLERWVRDYCRADTTRTNLILKSVGESKNFGQRLELYRNLDDERPLYSWGFFSPINTVSITHLEYRIVLSRIIKRFHVGTILVSSVIGHSLDILDTGLNTVKICHDYHPFCIAVFSYFNGVCNDCDQAKLRRCIENNMLRTYVNNLNESEAAALRQRFIQLILQHSITMVAPMEYVKRRYIQLAPELEGGHFEVIPHGVETGGYSMAVTTTSNRQRSRIVVLGRLMAEKGSHLLEESYTEITRYAELYLLGCGIGGRAFDGKAGVHVLYNYENDKLPGIVEEISPDLGLLLSIVPETFSYTLNELFGLHIPPMATNVGSFSDRITDGVNGFIFEPDKASLLDKLKDILSEPERLKRVRENLKNIPNRGLSEMVEDYHRLVPVYLVKPKKFVYKITLGEMIQCFAPNYRNILKYYLLKKTGLNKIEILFRQKIRNPIRDFIAARLWTRNG